MPDRSRSVPYTFKEDISLRTPVTERDVVQWLSLSAPEVKKLEEKYKIMENVLFKQRVWQALFDSVERITYRDNCAFAHSNEWQMLRCSFLSRVDVDGTMKHPEFDYSGGFHPWATMKHDFYLPGDHPEFKDWAPDLIFAERSSGNADHPVLPDLKTREIDEEQERLEKEDNKMWQAFYRRERTEKKTGKAGFAHGIWESDHPKSFPVLKVGKGRKARDLVLKHDGMVWKRYQEWKAMGN